MFVIDWRNTLVGGKDLVFCEFRSGFSRSIGVEVVVGFFWLLGLRTWRGIFLVNK